MEEEPEEEEDDFACAEAASVGWRSTEGEDVDVTAPSGETSDRVAPLEAPVPMKTETSLGA